MNKKNLIIIGLGLIPIIFIIIQFNKLGNNNNNNNPTNSNTPNTSGPTIDISNFPTRILPPTPIILPTRTPRPTVVSNPTPITLPTPTTTIISTIIPTINPTSTSTLIPTLTPTITPTAIFTPILIPTIRPIPTLKPLPTPSITPTPIQITSFINMEGIGNTTKFFNLPFGTYNLTAITFQEAKIRLKFHGGCEVTIIDAPLAQISTHVFSITNPTLCTSISLLPGETFNLIIETTGEFVITISSQFPHRTTIPLNLKSTGTKIAPPVLLNEDNTLELRSTPTESIILYLFKLISPKDSYISLNVSNSGLGSHTTLHKGSVGTYIPYVITQQDTAWELNIN